MTNNNLHNDLYFTGFTKTVAWRRYVARLVDMLFYPTLVFFVLSALGGVIDYEYTINIIDSISKWGQRYPKADIIFTSLFTSIIIIPINYLIFGQTLGKKLLGIVVVTNTGNKLGYGTALQREFQVFFKGLLFSWFSVIYQYFAFKKNNNLSWDRTLDLTVYYRNYSAINLFIRCIFAFVIICILCILNVMNEI